MGFKRYRIAARLDIDETINSLLETHDPDRFIHCIWFCFHSNRFVEDEFKNLKKVYNLYLEKLPVVVIYTQASEQKIADEMIDYIKEELKTISKEDNEKDNNEQIKVLKILAEDYESDNGFYLNSFGIYNLMKETSDSVKQGIESSCIQSLMYEGENLLKEELKEIINELNIKFFKNLNENIKDFSSSEIDIINEIDKEQTLIPEIVNFDFNYFLKFVKFFSKNSCKIKF